MTATVTVELLAVVLRRHTCDCERHVRASLVPVYSFSYPYPYRFVSLSSNHLHSGKNITRSPAVAAIANRTLFSLVYNVVAGNFRGGKFKVQGRCSCKIYS